MHRSPSSALRGRRLGERRVSRPYCSSGTGGRSRTTVPDVRSLGRELLQDRKSTRLNSSHTVISYAVFCLKKKKNRTFHRCARSVQPLFKTRHETTAHPGAVRHW